MGEEKENALGDCRVISSHGRHGTGDVGANGGVL